MYRERDIHVCVYIYICIPDRAFREIDTAEVASPCVYIYIYIYIYREREIFIYVERERYTCMCVYMYMYIPDRAFREIDTAEVAGPPRDAASRDESRPYK